jgi:hypothetical protein
MRPLRKEYRIVARRCVVVTDTGKVDQWSAHIEQIWDGRWIICKFEVPTNPGWSWYNVDADTKQEAIAGLIAALPNYLFRDNQ